MTFYFHKLRTMFNPGALFILLCLGLLLSSCNKNEEHWATKNISGLMPQLKFNMTESNRDKLVQGDDYRGDIILLYFGYTHCPDVCPLTLGRIKSALAHLGTEAKAIRVLFVSVDPARDNKTVLKSYTQYFGPQFLGLYASQPELRELTKRYRVTFGYDNPDKEGNYNVSHSSAIYAFDRKGEARLLIRPTDKVSAITKDLKRLLKHS